MSLEAAAQMAFIDWRNSAAQDKAPGAELLLRVFHCPNGEDRDTRVGAKLKRMGTRPGIPDLLYLGQSRWVEGVRVAGAHIGWAWELKAPGKRPSAVQRAVLAELSDEGFVTGWSDEWPSAALSLVRYLGLPERMAPGPNGEWADIRMPGS